MKPFAPLALALTLAATASAQTAAPFTDPANLRGERPRPRDGRELPIDGGPAADGLPNTALALQQLLRKLNTRASILNIVAHPDDEDGGMLTFYARGFGARVADLSLTRGEGGQNAMTADFEDALGLLRTQELLANDRYTGVDQMFGTEVDFGFSKTKEEAFGKWTHERCLYDAVRAIRLYRPLVITSTWVGAVTDGHGQHQVSGQIAQEAFKAAGDPAVFPDMIAEGILPWQPLKVYARVPAQSITPQGLFDYATGQYTPARFINYVTGEMTTTPPSTDVIVHEGTLDRILADEAGKPRSYIQFARIGLGLQKSQIGPGFRTAPAGIFDVPYQLYGTAICGSAVSIKNCQPERGKEPASVAATAAQSTFFDGVDTSVEGMLSLLPKKAVPSARYLHLQKEIGDLNALLTAATRSFDLAHPNRIAPQLADALNQLDNHLLEEIKVDAVPDAQDLVHELFIKRVQLELALALALDVRSQAAIPPGLLISGKPTPAHARIEAPDATELQMLPAIFSSGFEKEFYACLPAGQPQPSGSVTEKPFASPLLRECVLPARLTATITRPYFTRPNIEQPVYDLLDPQLRNAAATPPALTLSTLFTYHNARFEVVTVTQQDRQPVEFVPPASVAFVSHAQVLAAQASFVDLGLHVSPPRTRVEAAVPPSWKVFPDVEGPGAPPGFHELRLQPSASSRSVVNLEAVAVLPSKAEVSEGYRSIGYGDLPRANYYTPATVRIVPVDLKLPTRTRIAYLRGTGDSVPEALASIGLAPAILTVADLTSTRLADFDTVVLGVRTYNAHPDLHGAPTQALLDFARGGGNVVVQFQTAEFTQADAPYPLTLGYDAEKIVDETDPVRLLAPDNPLLAIPNRITPADFDGWVNERGHGILRSWDPRYTALTETHDPGSASEAVGPQEPQRGALVTTKLGKGRWTYCAFALYRQLPEANPGAFRLFANLLSLSQESSAK